MTQLRDHISGHYHGVATRAFPRGDYYSTRLAMLAMEAVDEHLVSDDELSTYEKTMDRGESQIAVLLMWLFASRTLKERRAPTGLPFPPL